jgi:hypothetical protein
MAVKRFILFAALALTSCGYHLAGHGDLVPKTVHSVCIPAFKNATSRYKLSDRLPEAISREFIARTKYTISTDTNTCDAILRGAVINYLAFQTTVDATPGSPGLGRATAADIHVILNITFTDRATGKVLYSNTNFDARERYEISVDPIAYFEESDAGLNRVALQVARQVVSGILNAF